MLPSPNWYNSTNADTKEESNFSWFCFASKHLIHLTKIFNANSSLKEVENVFIFNEGKKTHRERVTSVKFFNYQDKLFIISSSLDSKICLWSVDNKKLVKSFEIKDCGEINSLDITNPAQIKQDKLPTLLFGTSTGNLCALSSEKLFQDTDSPSSSTTNEDLFFSVLSFSHPIPILTNVWPQWSENPICFVGQENGQISVVECSKMSNMKILDTLIGHTQAIQSLSVFPEKSSSKCPVSLKNSSNSQFILLASSSQDNLVKIWKISSNNGTISHTFLFNLENEAIVSRNLRRNVWVSTKFYPFFAFSKDFGQQVKRNDAKKPKTQEENNDQGKSVAVLSSGTNGELFLWKIDVSVDENEAKWDVEKEKTPKKFTFKGNFHTRSIFSIHFFENDPIHFLTTSMDRKIGLWSVFHQQFSNIWMCNTFGGNALCLEQQPLTQDTGTICIGSSERTIHFFHPPTENKTFITGQRAVWKNIPGTVTSVRWIAQGGNSSVQNLEQKNDDNQKNPAKTNKKGPQGAQNIAFGTEDGHVGLVITMGGGKHQDPFVYPSIFGENEQNRGKNKESACRIISIENFINGKVLLSINANGICFLHEIENKRRTVNISKQFFASGSEKLDSCAIIPVKFVKNTNFEQVSSFLIAFGLKNGSIKVFELQIPQSITMGDLFSSENAENSKKLHCTSICEQNFHTKSINCMSWKETSNIYYLACGSKDEAISFLQFYESFSETETSSSKKWEFKKIDKLFAHKDGVAALDFNGNQNNEFLQLISCGMLDRTLKLWRIKLQIPQENQEKEISLQSSWVLNTGYKLFCVKWSLIQPNVVTVTGDDGGIYCIDINSQNFMISESSGSGTVKKTEKSQNFIVLSPNSTSKEVKKANLENPAPVSENSEKKDEENKKKAQKPNKKKKKSSNKTKTILKLCNTAFETSEIRRKRCLSLALAIADQKFDNPDILAPENTEILLYLPGKEHILLDRHIEYYNSQQIQQKKSTALFIRCLQMWKGDHSSLLKGVFAESGSNSSNSEASGSFFSQILHDTGMISDFFWFSMSPLAGKDVWKASMKLQASNLEKFGEFHLSTVCYLAIQENLLAIECLERAGLLKDAILLSKLLKNQTLEKKLFENLALQSQGPEEAAKAFLAIGESEKAALSFIKSLNFGQNSQELEQEQERIWKDCEKCSQGICFISKISPNLSKEKENLVSILKENFGKLDQQRQEVLKPLLSSIDLEKLNLKRSRSEFEDKNIENLETDPKKRKIE